MKPQQAIRILMLSPCYWLLDPPARKQLVREFCRSFDRADRRISGPEPQRDGAAS